MSQDFVGGGEDDRRHPGARSSAGPELVIAYLEHHGRDERVAGLIERLAAPER